jgi:tripartite-type tricarboxylate transporter receptor subunit TctC
MLIALPSPNGFPACQAASKSTSPNGWQPKHIKDGKLAALAVNSAKRSAVLPEVPTISEAGIKNAEYPFWIGAFLPAT